MLPDVGYLVPFLLAALALNLTPGPDMLLVIARSVGQGRAAGIAAALGIVGGSVVPPVAAAFGLAALLAVEPLAYAAVKFLGAAYLLVLGAKLLRGGGPMPGEARPPPA